MSNTFYILASEPNTHRMCGLIPNRFSHALRARLHPNRSFRQSVLKYIRQKMAHMWNPLPSTPRFLHLQIVLRRRTLASCDRTTHRILRTSNRLRTVRK